MTEQQRLQAQLIAAISINTRLGDEVEQMKAELERLRMENAALRRALEPKP